MSEWSLPKNTEIQDIERAGGIGYIWKSGVHKAIIKMAYLDQAKSDAISLNVVMENADGQTMKEALWIRSGTKKGNKSYYEKDGKMFPLPGYSAANSLCIAATGTDLPTVMDSLEKKMVKIYDYEAKKEIPQEKPTAMVLIGKSITVAVFETLEDKNTKGDDGGYRPSGDTRRGNESKFFGNAEGFSASEIESKAETAVKLTAWAEANTDRVLDKTAAKKKGTAAATPAATPPAAATLFN